MDERKIKSELVNKAVFPFLKLRGDRYSLSLSKDEAQEMGISKEDYNNVLKKLEETNDRIKKIRAEPNHDLILSDPHQAQLPPTSPNPSG